MPDSEIASLEDLVAAIGRFVSERDWQRFHTPRNLATALVVEAAELLETFQWSLDDSDVAAKDENTRAKMVDEIADVTMYLLSLARAMDVDIIKACTEKLAENRRRWPLGANAAGEWSPRKR